MCADMLILITGGEGEGLCYWYLVCKGQGCCSTSYNAQDTPPPTKKNFPTQNVNSAEVEKPWARDGIVSGDRLALASS